MLGDLKFCFMFVILCLSVCFRNVGCWHVPVLGPVAFAQGSKKKATIKGGQANWRPSLRPWGSASLRVNKPPLHCGGAPPHWRPSPAALLHPEGPSHDCGGGNQVLEQMVGPSVHECRGGGYLALADGWLGRRPPGPMPQLQGGVRHGLEVSRFPDFWPLWGGRAYSPRPLWHVPGGPWVWSLGLFSSIFFLHIHKQKKKQKKKRRQSA